MKINDIKWVLFINLISLNYIPFSTYKFQMEKTKKVLVLGNSNVGKSSLIQ